MSQGEIGQAQLPPARPTPGAFWRYWFRLGCISVGGPAAQIALMHQELVAEKRWISDARFLHALNYCMVLPGPEAQQMAVYMGWLLYGVWGGIVAGALFVVPAFVLLVALSWGYMQWGTQPEIVALLYGVKPLVVALIFSAAWRLANRVLHAAWLWAVFLLALSLHWLNMSFPAIILLAAVIGWGMQQYLPTRVQSQHSYGKAASQPHLPCVIDDHTKLLGLAHLQPFMLSTLVLAGLLGVGVLAALAGWFGFSHVYNQLALFFGKAAFLTFGGAYAVLPYVFEASVQHFHWLNAAQMLDGLALGESTPGPLIMVVTYIGFVAAWQADLPVSSWQAGLIGAAIVTWFTFLPSFVMVFLGAPWLERTRQEWHWAAPLNAISAAVVGGIVALALTLTRHVVWPQGIDWMAAIMVLLALWLLVKKRVSILWLLPGFMALGWLLKIG
jgi:chromate transporter